MPRRKTPDGTESPKKWVAVLGGKPLAFGPTKKSLRYYEKELNAELQENEFKSAESEAIQDASGWFLQD